MYLSCFTNAYRTRQECHDHMDMLSLGDHGACQCSGLPQIRARAGGDVICTENELLRHTPPHAHVQAGQHLSSCHACGVIIRELGHHS